MPPSDAFIAEHCDVASLQTNTGDWVRALACRRCGAVLWDVALHLRFEHGISE